MAKGYWMAHIRVFNHERYPEYIAANKLVLEKYGAKFLVRGGDYLPVEGEDRDRHVIVEFKSLREAIDCYNSPEYQKAIKLRQTFAESEVVIVEGV